MRQVRKTVLLGGDLVIHLTVESIDGLLSHPSSDPSINPLVLVALVLQEVLQEVQHLGHLQEKTGKNHFLADLLILKMSREGQMFS